MLFRQTREKRWVSIGAAVLVAQMLVGSAVQASGEELLVALWSTSTIERYSTTGQDLGPFATTGLYYPGSLAVDAQGYVYASRQDDWTVGRFSPTGTYLGTFARPGPGQRWVGGMTFDAAGNLYVAYQNTFPNGSITKYSPSGANLGTFASVALDGPMGLTFDRSGYLYSANYDNGTITKYSPSGSLVATYSYGRSRPLRMVLGPNGNLFASTDHFESGYSVEEYTLSVT